MMPAASILRTRACAGVAPVAPVLGALRRADALATPSRHLGLVQARERPDLEAFIAKAAAMVAEAVDLDAFCSAARPLARGARGPFLPPLGQRIAVARDEAFAFAYPHILSDWREAGAEIAFFSPLADEAPGPADAVFLPGGYPELHAGRLAAAGAFRAGVRASAEAGALIYGECGGYMALGEALIDAEGEAHPMTGLLPLTTSFANRKLTLGYRTLAPIGGAPFQGALAGHEFHYATTVAATGAPLFNAADAEGAALGPIGLQAGRVAGSFAHIIAPWP